MHRSIVINTIHYFSSVKYELILQQYINECCVQIMNVHYRVMMVPNMENNKKSKKQIHLSERAMIKLG